MSEPDARKTDSDEKPPSTEELEQEQNDSESSSDQDQDPSKLSPEEQLKRYEESLKNDDWGHQPC